MSNILKDREDIREAFKFLEGCLVRVKRGGKSIECHIIRVLESSVLSYDQTRSLPGVVLVTEEHGEIQMEMPHMLEETTTSFILDYNTPLRDLTEQERKDIVEKEDRRYYEFLEAGKGHKYRGGKKEVPPIVIEILETPGA